MLAAALALALPGPPETQLIHTTGNAFWTGEALILSLKPHSPVKLQQFADYQSSASELDY